MAKMKTDRIVVGALAGVLAQPMLWLAAKIPMVQVTFSTIEINLREKVTSNLIGGEFAAFIKNYIGISLSLPGIVMGAISGILLVMLAYFILDKIPFKPKKFAKLMTVIFIALLMEMLILNFLVVPTFGAIFGFIVAAAAVSGAIFGVYKYLLKKQLPE